jgi:glycosyltransferase involved in cell wall biosynthesis
MVPALRGVTRVIRMHGGHRFFAVTLGESPRPWRSWLETRSFGRADALCAVSCFVAETTRRLLRLGDRPIEILPNPVDVAQFRPRPEVAEEEGLVLFAGTVCEKKGIRQLVQAFPSIAAAVPSVRLVVAGRDQVDSRTGASFAAGLRGLLPAALVGRVEFLGHVDHDRLPDLTARAQVCVYPSHMEAMPVAWLEGLASGKAVLASRIGPGPELIEDGTTGLLCDPHDPASIGKCIVRLLGDAKLRQALGAAARERAVRDFSTDVLTDRNLAFYRRCVRGVRCV